MVYTDNMHSSELSCCSIVCFSYEHLHSHLWESSGLSFFSSLMYLIQFHILHSVHMLLCRSFHMMAKARSMIR